LVLVLLAEPLVLASGAPDGVTLDVEELDEGGVLEVSDGVVDDEPLIDELELVGDVVVELGVEVELDDELGVLGVTSVVDEVVDEDEGVAVVLLLRSQPVTAAVATASTATRGMSLFMTSPIRNGCDVGRSLTGPGGRCVQRPMTTHNACQCLSLGNGAGDAESGRETFRRD
jgi:hypothetical protein